MTTCISKKKHYLYRTLDHMYKTKPKEKLQTETKMASTSTVPKCPSPTLSMRQGAMVLRGITRFINRVRIQRRGGANNQSSKLRPLKNRERRMGEKDALKCSPKLIERMKKETLFTKWVFLAFPSIIVITAALNWGALKIQLNQTTPQA